MLQDLLITAAELGAHILVNPQQVSFTRVDMEPVIRPLADQAFTDLVAEALAICDEKRNATALPRDILPASIGQAVIRWPSDIGFTVSIAMKMDVIMASVMAEKICRDNIATSLAQLAFIAKSNSEMPPVVGEVTLGGESIPMPHAETLGLQIERIIGGIETNVANLGRALMPSTYDHLFTGDQDTKAFADGTPLLLDVSHLAGLSPTERDQLMFNIGIMAARSGARVIAAAGADISQMEALGRGTAEVVAANCTIHLFHPSTDPKAAEECERLFALTPEEVRACSGRGALIIEKPASA